MGYYMPFSFFNDFLVYALISFAVSIGLAFIPAKIAGNKGYSFGGFYVFGLFLFLVALIVALVIEDKSDKNRQFYYESSTPGRLPESDGGTEQAYEKIKERYRNNQTDDM